MGYVQEVGRASTGSGATSHTVPVTNAPTAGDLLILSCAFANANDTGATVSDSRGNTWTVQRGVTNADACIVATTMQDVATLQAGDTITVSFGATSVHNFAGACHEVAGYTDTVDASNEASSGGTATTARDAGSITTTAPAVFIWAAFEMNALETGFTPGSGYTTPAEGGFVTRTSCCVEFEYREVTSAGTYSATGTSAVSNRNGGVVVAFQAAAGGGTTYTDTPSGSITFSGSLIEAHTVADSPTGTITLSGSITESNIHGYSDAPSGSITLSGSLVEAHAVADSPTGSITLSGSLSETYTPPSLTYTDAPSGSISLSGSITESHTVSDSPSGAISLSGSIVESYTISDSVSGSITLSGSITEVRVYTDEPAGTISLSGSLTRATSRSSSLAGSISIMGDLIESYSLPNGFSISPASDGSPSLSAVTSDDLGALSTSSDGSVTLSPVSDTNL